MCPVPHGLFKVAQDLKSLLSRGLLFVMMVGFPTIRVDEVGLQLLYDLSVGGHEIVLATPVDEPALPCAQLPLGLPEHHGGGRDGRHITFMQMRFEVRVVGAIGHLAHIERDGPDPFDVGGLAGEARDHIEGMLCLLRHIRHAEAHD